jgi:hypothetical protein
MSISAAGYLLKVPSGRCEVLLDEAENGGSFYRSTPFVAEPVPNFEHSRRAPLIVFPSFEDEKITHIADGKRGASAGTGLARLNMQDLKALVRPIAFDELKSGVPKRLQAHLERVLMSGGILPPTTLVAFVDRIVGLDESVDGRFARYSERRREALRRLEPRKGKPRISKRNARDRAGNHRQRASLVAQAILRRSQRRSGTLEFRSTIWFSSRRRVWRRRPEFSAARTSMTACSVRHICRAAQWSASFRAASRPVIKGRSTSKHPSARL